MIPQYGNTHSEVTKVFGKDTEKVLRLVKQGKISEDDIKNRYRIKFLNEVRTLMKEQDKIVDSYNGSGLVVDLNQVVKFTPEDKKQIKEYQTKIAELNKKITILNIISF